MIVNYTVSYSNWEKWYWDIGKFSQNLMLFKDYSTLLIEEKFRSATGGTKISKSSI
jgi:hypothetical protein